MVLYTIKNVLPMKDILKTLPSSGISSTKKSSSNVVFLEPCLWYKNIYK